MGTPNHPSPQQLERPPGTPKKKRLWLGYSGENLRNAGKHRNFASGRKDVAERGASNAAGGQDTGYTKDNRRYSNLDELAAPPPVDEEEQKREPRLEDRGDEENLEKEGLEGVSGRSEHGLSRAASEIYTLSYLIVFSFFGTLARLGLQALTFYPGAPVQTGVLWANVGGSFIMGFLTEDRMLFQEEWGTQTKSPASRTRSRSPTRAANHHATKKTIPLYIGLATGFCGCFTSFSAFMRDAFFALSNALPVPINHPSASTPPSRISTMLNVHRNGGYSFLALLAVLITSVGLSLGSLQVGAHLAIALEPWTPSIPFIFGRKVIDRIFVFLAFGLWTGAIIMSALPPDRAGGTLDLGPRSKETWRGKALFSLVFAPLGCLLRFYASLLLNNKIKSFPLGTFSVNIFGSAMEAMFIDLQHAPIGGLVGCQVLQGMGDGFCGCLTTVSTWVLEIKGLRNRHAYVYAGTSIVVGLSAFIIITGSLMWTQGFKQPLCTN